jgi:hypothetical protein
MIQDYLERRLVQLDRHEFLRHIDECASCERELVNLRDVFTFLGKMETLRAPRGLQNAVISQLKSEGFIYQPKVNPLRRWTGAFLGLPAPAKYPLAALIVIAALYLPLKLVFAYAGGAAGRAVVLATDALVTIRDTLGDVSFLSRFWDVLCGYARALQTITGAFVTLVSSSTDGLWILGGFAIVALSAILLITRVLKKRSSDNAPLCL